MKSIKSILPRAALLVIIFTVICGVIYTGAITVISQLAFSDKANGSVIEVDGKKYGSLLLAQEFNDENHMWGRIMNIDIGTYKDDNGEMLMYGGPSNISPASEEYGELIEKRVEKIRIAHPEKTEAVPVDLVTCSGSGLDPEISVAAAKYQISRLAKNNNLSEEEINNIIIKCTKHKFLGIMGEDRVNVLKVNLMLDGILD